MSEITNDQIQKLNGFISDLYEIGATATHGDKLQFSLTFSPDPAKARKILKGRLKVSGYKFSMQEIGETLILTVDPKPSQWPPKLNIILFVLTLISVYFISTLFRYLQTSPTPLDDTIAALGRGEGLVFTGALISILLIHEMGHYIAGRRRGIITSWPYFIPAPNLIGTFGAVITSKSPFSNRRDLLEVGAAGPIAGWIVAAIWLIIGLWQTELVTAETIRAGQIPFTLMGESILMRISTLLVVGPIPADQAYALSEAAFAGWIGLLVTAMNLLPMGQFDGGHILYGLYPKYQRYFGIIALIALLGLGFLSPMWWFFAAIGLFFGVKHPATIDDTKKPTTVAVGMGICAVIILILSFTPKPF